MPSLLNDLASRQMEEARSARMTVPEVAQRLGLGRGAVYAMLEQGIIPGIRLGRRWIITRHAYEQWERTCGTRSGSGLQRRPEVTVLN
jgi:excisionase family DNA binding protein